MVNNQQITVLLQQFTDGTISKEDYVLLIRYLNEKGNDGEFYGSLDEVWKNTPDVVLHSKEEEEQLYQKLINATVFKENQTTVKPVRLWYLFAGAAVVLMMLAAGIYFLNVPYFSKERNRFTKNDIAPGGNKAILTLADGSVINLNDAKNGDLAAQAGIKITKTKNGEIIYSVKDDAAPGRPQAMNMITTPRGGTYQVSLPDGSRVWLNTSSSLKFPVQFDKKERKVMLQGEAYFEITKSKRRPFFVKTDQQEVRVLGTHFNVKAYTGDLATTTTLLEGAIGISFKEEQVNPVVLKPGQQALLNGGSALNVADVDTEQAVAWKNGLFMFNGQNLEDIMTEVARWYDVEVEFKDNRLKKQTFRGVLSRFKNISQLLEVLESTGSVKFKMEGRRITAM